ncbi:MAG: DUF6036 family nucleotidyltransferase [Anaerolineales bacterium]|nr:MAG: DUF6036 family nucleotidyltransferase [Anaerolineales bacterium]
MDNTDIHAKLQILGDIVPPASIMFLVGGSAMALLGSSRPTIDIDFVGDDVAPSELHKTIMQLARERNILVEPVPLERFVPLPEGSDQRSIRIGQFGNLEVFVADPYSISLSKLDRGYDTDLEDIVFLVQNDFIDLNKFEQMVYSLLSRAGKFDFNTQILNHLQELKNRLA